MDIRGGDLRLSGLQIISHSVVEFALQTFARSTVTDQNVRNVHFSAERTSAVMRRSAYSSYRAAKGQYPLENRKEEEVGCFYVNELGSAQKGYQLY